jgi:hypothetical protein
VAVSEFSRKGKSWAMEAESPAEERARFNTEWNAGLERRSVTYKSGTATTGSGRVVEVEIEVQTAPSRSIQLRWRDPKK